MAGGAVQLHGGVFAFRGLGAHGGDGGVFIDLRPLLLGQQDDGVNQPVRVRLPRRTFGVDSRGHGEGELGAGGNGTEQLRHKAVV